MIQLAGLLLIVTFIPACGSMTNYRSFVHPEADFSFYQKVGVLSFKNQAEDRLAGEKMTEHFMTELLIRGHLQVMDPGQFNGVIAQVAKTRVSAATLELSPDELNQVAEIAGVQGIFMGTVHDYKMIQLGGEQYPLISMTLKFIDAPTGTVAWQNSVTTVGGPNLPVVSIGETFTLGHLTQKVAERLASDFYAKAYSK